MTGRLVRAGLLAVIVWAFFVWSTGRAVDQEFASAGALTEREQPSLLRGRTGSRSVSAIPPTATHWQKKPLRWWVARARQNKRDANARGRTIRRLQHAQLRASSHFFNWLQAADCVHEHEGAWTSNTGNGYYGGLQADTSFQRAYAPDLIARYGGWAHTWPWYAQLQMAYRGWLFRGWQPWPNTSRMCGLR